MKKSLYGIKERDGNSLRTTFKGQTSRETLKNFSKFLFKKDYFKPNQTSLTLLKKENPKKTLKNYLSFLIHPIKKPEEFREIEERHERLTSKRSIFRKLLKPLTITGFIIMTFMIFLAVFAPWLAPYSYIDISLNRHIGAFAAPSPEHLFGTTELGRDLLSRLIYGSRESLTIGLGAIVMGYGFGTLFGIVAAFFGGKTDKIIMRIFDLIMSFPGLILAMTIIAVLGRTMDNILFAFGLLTIPGAARLMRSSVLQVKNNLYIESAQASGAKSFKIMFKHILPNAISPMIISISFSLGGIILGVAAMTFIGLGEPDVVEWGYDINVGQSKIFSAPWTVIWPGLFIAVTTLGFLLIGDGLRDALDPRDNS